MFGIDFPTSWDDIKNTVDQFNDMIQEALFSELMSNTTYSFDSLAAKYNHFYAPSYKIKAGTRDMVADMGLHAESVYIEQTIQNKSGCCRFTIQDAYDTAKHKFKSEITDNFKLGQEVTAGIGYGGQTRPLFKGYVADVSFSYGQGKSPTATILCNDIRALMQQGRINAMLPIASFPIMMMLIMLCYTSVLNMRIIYFDFWNVLENFQQNTNDFQYLAGYAEDRGYEFFVLGNHTYFRKKYLFTNPITTLSWGKNILSFDRNFTYAASQLKGMLNSVFSIITLGHSDILKPSYPFTPAAPSDINVQMDTSMAKNIGDLINIIASKIIKLGDDMVGGTVKCVGLPEIIPGRYIKIEGLDSSLLDKKYYIEQVVHEYNGGGYTTSFEISSGL